jgi:cytochrome c oxidase subunit 3
LLETSHAAALSPGGVPPHPVAHQFDTAEQQYEASQLGMWIFLANEIMFFGGVLAAYLVSFVVYAPSFEDASNHLNLALGAFNTVVLLASSLTMALAVHAAQVGDRQQQVRQLIWTLVLGSIFLVVKAYEYNHKFHEGLVPGPWFAFAGPGAAEHELFLSFYFVLTGLHAAHMVIGVGILAVLIVMARRGRFGPSYFTPVECSGLYWHFVDLVWIFLFPLLYLLGRH